ncbi:MAG: AMP-binding protein [Dehalococcoidia bacterium]
METIQIPWKSVGQLVEKASLENGHKTFLIFEGQNLGYADANKRINRIANTLRRFGAGKGDRISVMLPNGFDFPLTWLAIAKLGAVMVPTNVTYKEHDLEYILNDSESSLMLIHNECVPLLERVRPDIKGLKQVLVTDCKSSTYKSFADEVENASEEFHIEDVGLDDLLNIQYTSGTTGFPRGCMLTHEYWMLLGKDMYDMFKPQPDDVDLTAQPFSYMDGQWNVAMCMMAGIPLVIMPKFSVSKFWPTVHQCNVTFFYVLGAMPAYLLSRGEDELEKTHNVRMVACSAIVPELHATLERRFNCPWRETFGMTESGCGLFVPFDDTDCVGSGAMGKPAPTKEAKVVDNDGNDVPDGEVGELILRGQGLMLGYWKKPEATREVFRDGWLRTGDLAFKDEKGYFHWVGRLKDMVRRSGENISTAEVEGVLVQHEKVKVAAVLPVPDPMRGEEGKAYLILKDAESKETVSPQEIVEFARTKLAPFKVPRYIEYVTDLPRTPSERVEKHKLLKATQDLRLDSYDAEQGIWITQEIIDKGKGKKGS